MSAKRSETICINLNRIRIVYGAEHLLKLPLNLYAASVIPFNLAPHKSTLF